jgi:hypothetical protein
MEGSWGDFADLNGCLNEELAHRYAERATAVIGSGVFDTLEALWARQPLLLLGIAPLQSQSSQTLAESLAYLEEHLVVIKGMQTHPWHPCIFGKWKIHVTPVWIWEGIEMAGWASSIV